MTTKKERVKITQQNKEIFDSEMIGKQMFLLNLSKTKVRIIKKCQARLIENNITQINGNNTKNAKFKDILDEYERVFEINPIVFYFNEFDKNRKFIEEKIEKSKTDNESYVYFFVNEKYKFCKIGYSINPSERLRAIQTGCPFELTIAGIIKGDYSNERDFHSVFKHLRTYGEWFKLKYELQDFILDKFY